MLTEKHIAADEPVVIDMDAEDKTVGLYASLPVKIEFQEQQPRAVCDYHQELQKNHRPMRIRAMSGSDEVVDRMQGAKDYVIHMSDILILLVAQFTDIQMVTGAWSALANGKEGSVIILADAGLANAININALFAAALQMATVGEQTNMERAVSENRVYLVRVENLKSRKKVLLSR